MPEHTCTAPDCGQPFIPGEVLVRVDPDAADYWHDRCWRRAQKGAASTPAAPSGPQWTRISMGTTYNGGDAGTLSSCPVCLATVPVSGRVPAGEDVAEVAHIRWHQTPTRPWGERRDVSDAAR